MVTVHVGDEDGPQLRQRVAGVQKLVLGALSAIHQVPAARAAVLQGQRGNVAGFGGNAAGGAEKSKFHGAIVARVGVLI